ncbi:MAG: DUF2752 domain-containing protein [Solirubrobacteraceae bacterium]|nr:DUF2752 domain-containing protein [Solirubrobacteraceae bacterium]
MAAALRAGTQCDSDHVLRWRLTGHPVGSLCPVRKIVGVRCPGCGMTRAAGLAAQGEFAAATRMNPAIWLVLVAVCTFR